MKRYLPPFLLAAWVIAALPALAGASRSAYYDWGPYYQLAPQVLGVTYSASEGLPPAPLPPELLPQTAGGILPGDLFAPFDQLAENLQLTFTFNLLEREQLRLQFAGERLGETQTLIEKQRYPDAAVAAADYRDTLHTLATNLQNLSQTATDQAQQLLQQVESTAASHTIVAQSLAASAPPAIAEIWSQISSAGEQTLDSVADAADQPPIPEDLSASIQELKDQGLITPEESTKLYALDSRTAVRDELDKLVTAGQFPPAVAAQLDQAVADIYPDNYQHQLNVLQFAELRSYQTLPPPSPEIVKQIASWQAGSGEVPPPAQVRPYLYNIRAQELAQSIDLGSFSADHQSELAKFYPEAATQNPTFTVVPPSPTPLPSPAPDSQPEASPLPTPAPPAASLYLTAPTGPNPGDGTYFLKRFSEQLATTLTFNPAQKAQLYLNQAEERLREANALSTNTDRAADYSAALRSYQNSLLSANRIVDIFERPTRAQKEVAQNLETATSRHNLALEMGLLPPPANQPELITNVISATQDALDISADALGRPALPVAFSDRLQDLKAQGIILPEEVAALSAAASRTEVREQIRQLEASGAFPPAEAKRLDEAQSLVTPQNYNQLVEVRKIEELNRLRAIQAEFAQTASLRATIVSYEQRLIQLQSSTASPAGQTDPQEIRQQLLDSAPHQPSLITPDSPFYFLDRAWETVQTFTAFTPAARQRMRLAQANERFGEAYDLLKRGREDQFGQTLGDYTETMQQIFNTVAAGKTNPALGAALADQAARDNLLLQQAAVLASTEADSQIAAAVAATIQAIDRAADLQSQPALPDDLRARLQDLSAGMLTAEQEQAVLDADSRIKVRLALAPLTTLGVISASDTAFLDQSLTSADPAAVIATAQLNTLDEIATLTTQKEELKTKVEQTEAIAKSLDEFRQSYTPGQDIPTEIRPYVRLSRIDEVAQTIRPDIIRLEDFGNRRDVQLAVATLREEFRPTPELVRQVEAYRRGNPGRPLPPELARIEALSASLGVRSAATACFLPSPPFTPNTPCPPPGAALPFSNYYTTANNWPGTPGYPAPSSATSGEQLTYGKGPQATSPGVCPDNYHWMYDSGGWCMSNGGNYAPSTPTYSSTGPGYTPYSPYYSAPGSPQYGSSYYPPSNYYGPAPTYYTTNPPPGTVPGTGPAPTAPGQCPSGYHWMYDSGGWCMADGPTYVPGGASLPQSCSSGQSWSSAAGGCIPTGSTPGYYSPNLTQSSCGPGYYWDGRGCIATYSGGSSGPSPANSCQGFSCPSGYWLDYSSCSCKPSGTSGGSTYSPPSSSGSCQLPSGGCGPNSWYDYGSCSCRTSSTGTSTPTYSPPPSGSSSSSGSCPSGYHWMSDNGGWCMSDGAAPSTSTTTTTSSPAPTYSPPPPSEPAPLSAPAPSSEPAPAPPPSEPAPASTTSP